MWGSPELPTLPLHYLPEDSAPTTIAHGCSSAVIQPGFDLFSDSHTQLDHLYVRPGSHSLSSHTRAQRSPPPMSGMHTNIGNKSKQRYGCHREWWVRGSQVDIKSLRQESFQGRCAPGTVHSQSPLTEGARTEVRGESEHGRQMAHFRERPRSLYTENPTPHRHSLTSLIPTAL